MTRNLRGVGAAGLVLVAVALMVDGTYPWCGTHRYESCHSHVQAALEGLGPRAFRRTEAAIGVLIVLGFLLREIRAARLLRVSGNVGGSTPDKRPYNK